VTRGAAHRIAAWFRHWFRDRRDDDPDRPDWRALVDAVDFAAEIAVPRWDGKRLQHVIRTRTEAQIMADVYYGSAIREAVDGELFALEAALAEYPDDFWGRRDAVRRFDYIWEKAR
jgi:hypothetical protein